LENPTDTNGGAHPSCGHTGRVERGGIIINLLATKLLLTETTRRCSGVRLMGKEQGIVAKTKKPMAIPRTSQVETLDEAK
jgi:hypothetical protein